jgi:hypothetical protein
MRIKLSNPQIAPHSRLQHIPATRVVQAFHLIKSPMEFGVGTKGFTLRQSDDSGLRAI